MIFSRTAAASGKLRSVQKRSCLSKKPMRARNARRVVLAFFERAVGDVGFEAAVGLKRLGQTPVEHLLDFRAHGLFLRRAGVRPAGFEQRDDIHVVVVPVLSLQ
jgi:hypothetical protein